MLQKKIILKLFYSLSPACGSRRLFFSRSAVFWSKSSRRVGRERGRAGRPRRGSTGGCRHHLVRPPLTDTRGPRNQTSDGSRALTRLTFNRSRGVVRIQATLTFEPEKINIFNKDCRRGGKEVTCMSVIVCLSLDFRTRTRTKSGADVGKPRTSLHRSCPPFRL